jgi:hypothetical protein
LAFHHPLQHKKKNLDVGFSWVARNNDKPFSLSSFLSFFSSFVEDDDELEGLSLSLSFFPHLQKMTTSWDPNSSSSLIVFLQS